MLVLYYSKSYEFCNMCVPKLEKLVYLKQLSSLLVLIENYVDHYLIDNLLIFDIQLNEICYTLCLQLCKCFESIYLRHS